ncbi:MAG: ABC transporter ATP-binding protein [Candidatus Hodarchaeota archaeon]
MEITEKKKIAIENSKTEQLELDLKDKSEKLLEVRNLKVYFYTEEGIVKAVDGVSFDIYKDEVLGLVGETGCGKSVTALSILQLVGEPGQIIEGSIKFNDINLLKLSTPKMREYRGNQITMIFQDPLNSLNPVMSVGKQLSEVFLLHQKEELHKTLDNRRLKRQKLIDEKENLKNELRQKEKDGLISEEEEQDLLLRIKELRDKIPKPPLLKNIALEEVEKIIKEVGIADAKGIIKRYPHELSGGMRQRIMISMALSCNPQLLIADEPTTALDVTIQAQILDLMNILKKKFRTSLLLITHDLGIIAETCDRIAVMYSGNIVEYATANDLFKNPRHPYTQGLIGAIPSIETKDKELKTIRGMVPNLIYPPSGCRFHPRCDERLEICDKIKPSWIEISDRYYVACHLYDPKHKDSPKYEWKTKEDIESYKV